MSSRRILLDIETQRDFFLRDGNLYRKNATPVASNIYRLFSWVRKERVPVLSTVLRVRRDERGPYGDAPHLVEGTDGEMKLPRTILPNSLDLGLRNTTDLPENIFDEYQQVIVEKRDTDILSHARLERLITELTDATFIICGAGVSRGIVEAVVGLRSRGYGVILVQDAVLDLQRPGSEMAWLRMEAKGAVFTDTAEIVAPKPRERAKPFRDEAVASRR